MDVEVTEQKQSKPRPDYKYRSYDKAIRNATKPVKSSAIMLPTPHDTPLKIYMDQGYQITPLKESEFRTLTVYGYDIHRSISPIIEVDILLANNVISRVWLPKNEVPYTDWADSIPKKLLHKLYKIGFVSSEEWNFTKLPNNYYTQHMKGTTVWLQPIKFQGRKYFAMEREKVRILDCCPSQHIGSYGPELRVYSYKHRQQYDCNQILVTSEKNSDIVLLTIAMMENIDFMDFLYFAALNLAIQSGANISKVIDSNLLPKYININSIFYKKINDYFMHIKQFAITSHINDDICIYYFKHLIRKTIDKHTLNSVLAKEFTLSASLYNINEYGLKTPPIISETMIKYLRDKQIKVESADNEITATIMVTNPNQIQLFNTKKDIAYNGCTKSIVSAFITLKYIRKYEAFIVAYIALKQKRN